MLQGKMRIRVEWSHCDPAGIIFIPHYYIWMDAGTHQLLTAAGFAMAEMVRSSPFRGCPLVSSRCDFVAPCRYGDRIELWTEVERFGTKSFAVSHEFRRAGDTLARGQEVRVWGWSDPVDPERLTAIAVPDEVRAALAAEGVFDTSV